MPLFVKDDVSILYVHVPKTGGTSIEQFFFANGFRTEYFDNRSKSGFNDYRTCSPQHLHAAPLLMLLRPAKIRFIFMTVRHPLTRVLSEYKMQVRAAKRAIPLSPWFDLAMATYMDDPYTTDNHFRPQHEFLIPGCDVFRQEDGYGQAFVARLSERTGLAFAENKIGNYSADTGQSVDEEGIERIRPFVTQFYRHDFATFGYPLLP